MKLMTTLLGTALLALTAEAAQAGTFAQATVQIGKGKVNVSFTPSKHAPAFRKIVRRKQWIAGHYETRYREVYHAGRYENVWRDAVYADYANGFGGCFRVLVQLGHHEMVWRPAYYTTEAYQVWVAGYWTEVDCED